MPTLVSPVFEICSSAAYHGTGLLCFRLVTLASPSKVISLHYRHCHEYRRHLSDAWNDTHGSFLTMLSNSVLEPRHEEEQPL